MPPLAGGCGIGEGEVWGDDMRGFDGAFTVNESVDCGGCGEAFRAAAVPAPPRAPNCISLRPDVFPATAAPFGRYPEAPAALIVTELFRLWSPIPDVELVGVLPLTMVGEPTVGMAGGIAILPFTGELVSSLPCCPCVATPEAELPEVEEGENVRFVALA